MRILERQKEIIDTYLRQKWKIDYVRCCCCKNGDGMQTNRYLD